MKYMDYQTGEKPEAGERVVLKVSLVTAIVLLVLFGLYWGGKKLLLTPDDVSLTKDCENIRNDFRQATIDAAEKGAGGLWARREWSELAVFDAWG